jgi:hypothetical protein
MEIKLQDLLIRPRVVDQFLKLFQSDYNKLKWLPAVTGLNPGPKYATENLLDERQLPTSLLVYI